MAWENELNLAIEAAKAAGVRLSELALDEKEILSAKGRDIKLQADRDSEAIILKMLSEGSKYPVLAEESGEVGDVPGSGEGTFWAVDPLDGTFNFSRGVPVCGVSIALVAGTEPVVGVFYDFNRGDLLCVDRFGASAPASDMLREYGFSMENVYQRALALVEKTKENP